MTITRGDDNIRIDGESVTLLRRFLDGNVICRDDAAYDEVNVSHNVQFQHGPCIIVQAANAADVITTVTLARERGLELGVRSGGHNIYSTSDDVLLDLSLMRGIAIDPAGKTARIQPGATWGEVSAAAQEHGLAIPAGDSASVGVGGLTVGGGIGWLVRKHGLTIDSLLAVEIVTADGQLRRASATENADLFWAVRGGGGNFGVITAFEFKAHEVGMIVGGAVFYDAADGEQVLRRYADYASQAPEALTTIVFVMHAPPLPFLPAESHGKLVVAVGMCYAGNLEEGTRVVQPLRELATPLADVVAPMPYTAIYALTADSAAMGMRVDVRSTFTQSLSDETIKGMLEHMEAAPSPFALGQIRVLGGEMARVAADETAFSHRDAKFMLTAINCWLDSGESEKQLAWTNAFLHVIPDATSGVYVNFLGDESDERVREAYSESNYQRLVAIKDAVDPGNFFHMNHNIRPSGDVAESGSSIAA